MVNRLQIKQKCHIITNGDEVVHRGAFFAMSLATRLAADEVLATRRSSELFHTVAA